MGLFGPSKKEIEEVKKKKEEEERLKQEKIAADAVEAFKQGLVKKGRTDLTAGGKPFRVSLDEPRRACMCIPETSSKGVARMNYEDLNCDHHTTQKALTQPRAPPMEVQELEAPVVVFDKERDGGVDRGRPMVTQRSTQPRPQTLEDEDDDLDDDGASDEVYIPQIPRPKPHEKPPTRFNGKALDPRTGKVYYFNTITGERKWADRSEQPKSREIRQKNLAGIYGSTMLF